MLKAAISEIIFELRDIEKRLHEVSEDTDLSLVSIALSLRRLALHAKKLSKRQNRPFELTNRDKHRVRSLAAHARLLRQVLEGTSIERLSELHGIPKSEVLLSINKVIRLLRHFAQYEIPEGQTLLALPWASDEDVRANAAIWLDDLNGFEVELGRLADGIPSLVNAWIPIFPVSFGAR